MTLSQAFAQDAGEDNTDQPVMISQSIVYFVATNGLRVRSIPEDSGKTMGLLSLNEKVRVVTGELINGKYVEVQILGTVNPMAKQRSTM